MNSSKLYDQNTFYPSFLRDLLRARQMVIIESPFLTERRVTTLLPDLKRLAKRGVHIIVNTKPFNEHTPEMTRQAIACTAALQAIGVEVLMTTGHHRKVAIIDETIAYEGSLNILSQSDSCEIMHRIEDRVFANELVRFTGMRKWCR